MRVPGVIENDLFVHIISKKKSVFFVIIQNVINFSGSKIAFKHLFKI